jgi:hypothetical protein
VFALDIVHGRLTLSDAPARGVATDLRGLDRFVVPTT